MKKITFYTALGISILLLINILDILITDLDRLTNYGYGYLMGKLIVFLVFMILAILTRKNLVKTKN